MLSKIATYHLLLIIFVVFITFNTVEGTMGGWYCYGCTGKKSEAKSEANNYLNDINEFNNDVIIQISPLRAILFLIGLCSLILTNIGLFICVIYPKWKNKK